MSSAAVIQEHELSAYQRVQVKLEHFNDHTDGGMRIKTTGHLIGALDRVSCIPFVSFPAYDKASLKISVGGEDAGTLDKPDVDVILKHSKPSPFGKGDKTVMDETYRRGREISAADIVFPAWEYNDFMSDIIETVSATLFVPKNIKIKLYKLAIYGEGGHFDWHMDSTHSDHHHATVLVALNTAWTGGDFILKRNGVETRVDMKPRLITPKVPYWTPFTALEVVAFYTDIEHKVEPVTDGVRIVLQFDVEVKNWLDKKEDKDTKHKAKQGKDDEDDEDDDDMVVDEIGTLYDFEFFYKQREPHQNPALVNDPAVTDEVLDIIGGLLKPGQEEVGFALQYLYRHSSIVPEFLKGSDSLLYKTLAKTFDVSLHPVVLHERTDYDGKYRSKESKFRAYKYDHTGGEDVAGDKDFFDEIVRAEEEVEKSKTTFYMPLSSALAQLSRQDYVERTGNEAMLGDQKYFGGGMFVRRKDTALDGKGV